MESIITIATALVVLYVLIKITNSKVTTIITDTGVDLIEVNAKELKFDATQRYATKLVKAKESGKIISASALLELEVLAGLVKPQEL